MIKQLVPLLVLIILLKPIWPLAEYVVNYDYIVDKLCENKSKPMLNCNGKCYLAKQLAKESENKENPFERNFSKLELPIINWITEQNIQAPIFEIAINLFEWHSKMHATLYVQAILQPPKAT